jgi:hypothetical protein
MGYGAKTEQRFFSALSSWRRTGAGDRGLVEGRDCSWGNLNQFSDFLQEIVGSYSETC